MQQSLFIKNHFSMLVLFLVNNSQLIDLFRNYFAYHQLILISFHCLQCRNSTKQFFDFVIVTTSSRRKLRQDGVSAILFQGFTVGICSFLGRREHFVYFIARADDSGVGYKKLDLRIWAFIWTASGSDFFHRSDPDPNKYF